MTYQTMTCVPSCRGLHPTTLLGPSASDRYPMKVVTGLTTAFVNMATWDLRCGHRFCHPVR
jgi:hypothetical protein